MDVYGLTGGIGSGKSAVAVLLEEYGIPVVSADELSRMVVAPGSDGLRDVVSAFGDGVLAADGSLDRRAMGQIVFSDPAKRRTLEGILHPRIRERYEQVLDALDKSEHRIVVYEVPLLFEKKLQSDVKAVVLVSASEAARIARVRARDGLSREEVERRMAAQMSEEDKRQRADYVVQNDGSMDDLRREVEFMISRFLKMPARGLRRRAVTAPQPTVPGPHNPEAPDAPPSPEAPDAPPSPAPATGPLVPELEIELSARPTVVPSDGPAAAVDSEAPEPSGPPPSQRPTMPAVPQSSIRTQAIPIVPPQSDVPTQPPTPIPPELRVPAKEKPEPQATSPEVPPLPPVPGVEPKS
jgi:dephospho-CoA kinase